MPRKRRHWVPGLGAHIISRFVDRRFFLQSQTDRELMLHAITRANRRWDWQWMSWALMSSHVHYGTIAGGKNPDRFFASAHTRFALRYHRERNHETLGPVFASRPDIHPVGRQGLLRMVAYQHRNPDEAGVVTRPSESRWTSHRFYLRLEPAPLWFDVEHSLDLLGFADTERGRREFDEYVTEVDLSGYCPEQEARPEAVIRSEPTEVDWDGLEQSARELTGLPASVPLNSRKRHAVLTRWLVVQVAVVDLSQSYGATSAAVGISRGAVCNLISRGAPTAEAVSLEAELRRRIGLAA